MEKPDRLDQKFEEARRMARLGPEQEQVYRRLASVRARLGAEGGLPAYQVLSNRQLLAMCERRPRSEAELYALPGMSRVKVLAYGAELIAAITA